MIRNTRLVEPSIRSTRLLMTGTSPTNSSTAQYASTTADVTDLEDNIERPPFPIVLWRFTRPHTLIGSALAIPALHLLAASSLQTAFTWQTAASSLYAMVPSLLMNLYITGLNQITDVEIDKINKPHLPIAAGILSQKTAIITVLVALVSSLWMGSAHPIYSTQGLKVALWGSGILGTLYSVEPFRLKRYPLLAAFCIVTVRGTIINAGFYAHARQAAFGEMGATVFSCLANSSKCFRSSLFFAVFGVVIALMKDVPDVAGDESSNVRTFSVRVGQKRVFHATRRLLAGLFVSVAAGFAQAVPAAANSVVASCRGVTAVLSLAAAWSVRKEAQPVDPEDPKQVYSYYMHLWKIFYLSYLVLPFAR
jgi:homogentisate phytyltransferase/homogentisate geranylgeranyltransferase